MSCRIWKSLVLVLSALCFVASSSVSAKTTMTKAGSLFASKPISQTGQVMTSFTFKADEDSDVQCMLAGLSTTKNRVNLGVGLVLMHESGIFGETSLRLVAKPGVLPKALVDTKATKGAWGPWEAIILSPHIQLDDVIDCNASLGYDMKTSEVSAKMSVRRKDGRSEVIWQGRYPAVLPSKALYPTVAVNPLQPLSSRKQSKSWNFTITKLQSSSVYFRAPQPGVIGAQGWGEIGVSGGPAYESDDEPGIYPGTKLQVTMPQLPISLPGRVVLVLKRLTAQTAEEVKRFQVPLGAKLGAKDMVANVTIPAISPGHYLAVAEYVEGKTTTFLAKAKFNLVTGLLKGTLTVSDERPWVADGRIIGTFVYEGKRLPTGVKVILESRPLIPSVDPSVEWAKAWETTIDNSGKGSLPFEYKAAQREYPEEFRIRAMGQEGLYLTCSVSISKSEFWVSPNGNDKWSGRRRDVNGTKTDGPFLTLARARDAIRDMKSKGSLPVKGVTVWVDDGIYRLSEELSFSDLDSGTPESNITYRAIPNAKVTITGGKPITSWKPYKEGIFVADLTSQGIGPFDSYQQMFRGNQATPPMEVFAQGKRQQLARWPNADPTDERGGTWEFVASSPGTSTDRLRYPGSRPEKWKNISGAMVNVWPDFNWHDELLPLAEIDVAKHELVLGGATEYAIKPGRRFAVLGLLEELDAPGEWYYDQGANKLYLWPSDGDASGKTEPKDVCISSVDTAISCYGVSNVSFRGLTFEAFRGTALRMSSSSEVSVVGCTFHNLGGLGVTIEDSVKCGIVDSDISYTGRGGITLSGGDRPSLTPGDNYAVNNHIHHFGRIVKCYQAGIVINGVGNRIAHNLIHDGPHNAILLGGNEHVIEYNEIHHVCMEGADSGAFYMGRDWSQQGNVLRSNYFHDIAGYGLENEGGTAGPWRYEAPHAAWAIYLDDCSSGTTITGNLFVRVPLGSVMIGGGRSNTVSGNVIIDSIPAIHLDARWDGYPHYGDDQRGKLEAVNYTEPPYSTKYPNLLKIYDKNPRLPSDNVITGNVISYSDDNWRGSWNMSRSKNSSVVWEFQNYDPDAFTVDNNLIWHDNQPVRVDSGAFLKGNSVSPWVTWQAKGYDTKSIITNPLFVEPKTDDYRFAPNSPALSMGIQQLETEKMGLFVSEDRPTLPAKDDRKDGLTFSRVAVTPGQAK